MLVARLLVPLTIPQRLPVPAGPGSGLSLIVGGGLSLAIHLTAITMLARAPLTTDTEAPLIGEATALPIMVSAVALEEDAPPAPAAVPALLTGARLPAPATRTRRRRSLPAPQPVVAIAPADLTPVPLAPAAVEQTSLPAAVVEKTSAVGAARPQQVSSEVGRGLRLEDDYPQLPRSLRNAGFEHVVLLEVCVSVRGAVDDIRFASHTTGQLRRDLEQAIRGWRYRPLIKDGAAVPYCHQMRIQYRMT